MSDAVAPDAVDLTLSIDRAWWPLGDGSDPVEAVLDVLIEHLAPDLPTAEEQALRASLAVYADWAASLSSGQRNSFALVRDPARGRADALLSWRLGEIPADGYERFLASARAMHSDSVVELVNPTVSEVELPVGRAIVVHDIAYSRTPGVQRPARERCIVAIFPTDEPVLLELSVSTIDLSLFDDLPDYVLRLASGEELGVPGYRESVEGAA